MVKVFVAIPSTGTLTDLHMHAFRQYERDYGDEIQFIWPVNVVHRKFHDFARNCLVDEFLASDADILWFVDSDVVPPPHVLDLITKYGDHWDLAGAPYPVFMTPKGYKGPQVVMCVYKASPAGLHAAAVPHEGREFVDGLATGCMFIKRDVFSKLEKPYFEFKYDRDNNMYLSEGEDLNFCRRVNSHGYKFFTDYGMVCKHYKTVDLLEVNNYAVDYANQAVTRHHENLREGAMVAVKEAYERGKRAASGRTKSGLILPE